MEPTQLNSRQNVPDQRAAIHPCQAHPVCPGQGFTDPVHLLPKHISLDRSSQCPHFTDETGHSRGLEWSRGARVEPAYHHSLRALPQHASTTHGHSFTA